MPRELMNLNVIGHGIGQIHSRRFQAIDPERVVAPDYQPRYFETFPSMWAEAYAFEKALDLRRAVTVEEWACLFLLHYFKVAHFEWISREALRRDYDGDLWPSLAGTYPVKMRGGQGLSRVGLLRASDGTVLAAYYPSVVFFPARNRTEWNQRPSLAGTLTDHRTLEWRAWAEKLAYEDGARREFFQHLRNVATFVLEEPFSRVLLDFCEREMPLRSRTGAIQALEPREIAKDPATWIETSINSDALLKKYPLKKGNARGGTTYFLLDDLNSHAAWMTDPIAPGLPSVAQYSRAGERAIAIDFAGQVTPHEIGRADEIVLLKDLLLERSPAFCGVRKLSIVEAERPAYAGSQDDAWNDGKARAKSHAEQVVFRHRVDVTGRGGDFDMLGEKDEAVCLLPIRRKFLEYFPEFLENPAEGFLVGVGSRGLGLEWSIRILGRDVPFHTGAMYSRDLPNLSVAIWPSVASPDWRLYVAWGTGVNKDKCGQLVLVDERGRQAKPVELARDTFVSVLAGSDMPNRPRALVMLDAAGDERGVLFPEPVPECYVDTARRAALAVDFGTSNTCLAARFGRGDAEVPSTIRFGAEDAPAMLWGTELDHEVPGFIPFRWSGEKGYFPSIYLKRIAKEADLASVGTGDLRPEHLFMGDIPGLHKGLAMDLARGSFSESWAIYDNLKWDAEKNQRERTLFLATILLYAHANCMRRGATFKDYVFTYPLAFPLRYAELFHEDAQRVVERVRSFVYGPGNVAQEFKYIDRVDESQAMASEARANANSTALDVFLDVGGGTADLAVRHRNDILVLDSVEMAGKAFFAFARESLFEKARFKGGETFEKHLNELLFPQGYGGYRVTEILGRSDLDLVTGYSALVNELSDDAFRKRELVILDTKMGRPSYQRYRSVVFFRHLLAYALIQAAAAAVDHRLTLDNGIKLILGGNAWGLLMFAEFERSRAQLIDEAKMILRTIKSTLGDKLDDERKPFLEKLEVQEVELMNAKNLSSSKTAVAKGALRLVDVHGGAAHVGHNGKRVYAGMTLENLGVNGEPDTVTVNWHDLWAKRTLCPNGAASTMEIERLDVRSNAQGGEPMDPTLRIFTALANLKDASKDVLPPHEWSKINSRMSDGSQYLDKSEPGKAPLNHFLHQILYPAKFDHDVMHALAETMGMCDR